MKTIHVAFAICLVINIRAQITVTNTQNATQLVQNVLLGAGVTASNIKLNGSLITANSVNQQIGYFEKASSTFPISRGIVMSTGFVPNVPGLASQFASNATGSGSDPDLVTISGVNIFDRVVLEFDFVATGDSMQFKYMFASEEYPEFVGGGVNDAFGFFLSGPGILGTFIGAAKNIALIPGGLIPVSINTVNQNINTTYYTSNATNIYGTSTKMDGMTVIMTALSSLQCGGTYHIKLALGDGGDGVYDSSVYLEAESFKSNVVKIEAESTLANNFTDTLMAEACVSTYLVFSRPEIYQDSLQEFILSYGGTADPVLDFTNLPDTIVFPIGVDTVTFLVTPVDDGIVEPMEFLDIYGYSITVCGDTIYDSIRLYVVDQYNLTYNLPDSVLAVCVQHQPSVNITNYQGSIGPYSTSWSFGVTTNPANLPNNGFQPDTITYYVNVTDGCGDVFPDSVVLVVDSLTPSFAISPSLVYQADCLNDIPTATATLVNQTIPPYAFNWSTGAASGTTTLPNFGINFDTIYYTVQMTDGCGNVILDSVLLTTNFAVPEFTISPNDTLYASCPTALVTVTLANNTGGAYSPYIHDWSNGQSGIPMQLSNNGVPGDQQWHYVFSTNICGMSTIDSVLIINNYQAPSLALSPNDTLYVDCIPDSAAVAVLVTNSSSGPYSYAWSNGGTNMSTFMLDNGQNGETIPFSVSVTDGCGLTSSANGVLIVNQTLKIDSLVVEPSISCDPTGMVSAFISGQVPPVAYLWTDGAGGQIASSVWTNRPSGWYYFSAKDAGCTVKDSIFVPALNAPSANAFATPSSGYSPLSVQFTNLSANGTNYYWDFGNGQTLNTSGTGPVNMVYTDTGEFTVMLVASQGSNCADTFYLTILVSVEPPVPPIPPVPPTNFDLPNVFSPNGDGSNDVFTLNAVQVKNVELRINNRWGNTVFLGSGVNPSWDGLMKSGKEAEDGVYFYQYEVITLTEEVISGQGFVQLIRK